MTLCDRCSTISITSLLSKEGHVLHPDLSSLYSSAPTCELCGLLLSRLYDEIEKHYAEIVAGREPDKNLAMVTALKATLNGTKPSACESSLSTHVTLRHDEMYQRYVRTKSLIPRLRRKPTEGSSLGVYCGTVQCDTLYVSVHVPSYVYSGDVLQLHGFHVRDQLAPSSVDSSVVAKVKKWMEHCATNHPECHKPDHGPDSHPRRLLDLHGMDDTKTLQIIDVPDDFENDYVALSYCWGKAPRLWIERIRRVQHSAMKMIEFESMPQTIKDAVISCVVLDYSYLWVDGLCIIQNDESDWLHESARMDTIFTNSALVITASATANCSDGFLMPRSLLQQQGVIVPICVKDDNGHETVSSLHLCSEKRGFEETVGQGPVAGRAWCLQERQLAPRVLHMCQDEVTFECTLSRRFESESLPMDDFNIHSEFNRLHIPEEKYQRGNPKPSASVKSIFGWYGTVEDYTLRRLTVDGDKLIAISGLARRASRDLAGRYLAGLWEQQLHIGLAWKVPTVQAAPPSTRRAPTYRAPSWSWASIDGPVNWQSVHGYTQSDDGYLVSTIDVHRCAIDLIGSDPFGPVKYAELLLTGPVLSISTEVLLRNEILKYPTWMSGRYPGVVGCYIEDEPGAVAKSSEVVVCLKIATKPFGPGPSIPPTNEMLVLRRVTPSRTDKNEGDDDDDEEEEEIQMYRRIGFGQVLVTDYFDQAPVVKLKLV